MALYKEVVKQHQNSIIIKVTAIIICVIVISDSLRYVTINGNSYSYLKYIIDIGMIIIFIKESKRFRLKYKYSVIQDQLMIYKIIKKNEKLLRVVNFNDIVKIRKCTTLKDKVRWFIGTRYDFYKPSSNYICIYNDNTDGTIKRFYFNPSSNLLRILKNCKCGIE